ncbi:type IV conjugative transfer system coupling protein TraD [Enterobacter kobei]|uniref:type IV conjugative transfer system coupling protein TraD n=1 Tax=Enterobacter TaxID=547 RepID=UPI000D8EF95A|nr:MULTISPECIES: type IV conjugative transfer system coupling protein TraD [Enterobacter]HAS0831031.1 type IV conjugative transfer system coupling protein TraD [Enterobacter cloacae subsp. cloacae]EKY1504208.1 type IV conjugative transfer system coupling protein TraD [Enterobacter cloacae]MBH0128659.1 type IV conjugative transfer system coupling protein TraD [Enterobacter sp. SECR18-0236]NWJ80434.1 type IV conjugative transfer system coupling protein TraD [Enterobacter sp. SECR19-1250]PYZ20241
MSFAGKNLTQGGQMTAYRWRMFIQVNNWIGFWIFILFAVLTTAIFLWRIPQEALDNGSLWWFASINSSFIDLMPASGTPKIYDVHYWYAPTATAMVLKMTLPQIYTDPYMQAMGDQCLRELQWAAGASGLFSMVVFIAVTWFIANIGRKESEDEYLSGMQLTDKPSEVNKLLRQNGELSDLRVADLHMVKRAEVMNFLMHGTINVGKSTIIRWLLDYIRKRGDRAIIYDSGCTFTETHYNPSTDFILNAHDERCANWQMWGECIDAVDYDNLAASLIPVEGESDPFWVSSSRTICADLAIRMSVDPDRSIEKFLKTLLSLSMKSLRQYLVNTPSANLVEEKIEKTAISIRSVVTNYAKALRFLQGLDDGTKPPFTIREWMTQERYDSSWLFISTQARHRKSVRPLISLWVSLATLLLQSMGENSERRVWFILDEAPSLQRIPELAETLAEARKFGGCFVLGMQNMAQLVHVYGRELAKSIFDLMNTRMYGRSPSAEMAKVVEEELGNQRKRKIREQNSYGLDQVRDGVSLGKDEVNNPIVDYEQIMRLPNLNFYVRLPGEYPVVRLKLKYRPFKKRHAGLIERNIHDALSPELERVIQANERAATAAGLTFPTGDEVLEKGNETSSAAGGPAPVSSAGASGSPAASPVEKVARTRMEEPKPSRSAAPELRPVPSREPVTSRTEPVVPEVVTESHSTVTDPVTGDKKDNVVSLRPSKPAPNHQKGTASLNPEIPAALQKIRSRTQLDIPSEPAAAGALGMLKRRLSTKATSDGGEDQASENAGESMNLDMKVTALPDGGLSLATAGKSVTPKTPDEAHGTHRQLAQEEENILLHRHADDSGYDENDHYYYDREPEL